MTLPDCSVGHAYFLGPFLQRQFDSTYRLEHRCSAISDLLLATGPSAILRRIWPIVVDAIQRHTNGTLAHVLKKIEEVLPAAAYRYSAASIQRVGWITRHFASTSHADPHTPFWCVATAMLRPVFFQSLPLKASARLNGAMYHGVTEQNLFRSAVAPEQPTGLAVPWMLFGSADSYQSAKPLAD